MPLLLLTADLLYWGYAVRQLEAGLQTWVAAQRAEGWTVQGAPPAIGGWPAAARLTLTGVALEGGRADIPGGLRWSAERVVLRVALLHPQMLQIAAGGRQQLRLGTLPSIPFTSDRMVADLPLQVDAPPRGVQLRAETIQTQVPEAGATAGVAIGTLTARASLPPDAASGESALAFSVDAGAIALPPQPHWVFGRRIETLSLEGELDGRLTSAPDLAERAVAWRDGGGKLEIRHFGVRWGALDLSGAVRLGLDPQLQPVGSGSVRVVGYDEALDRLAASGALSRSAVVTAKAVLSLMAQPGHPAAVEVPLSVQDRILSLQRIPMVRLPALDWPRQ